MKKTYNKLVRDNIPQIIERDGKRCTTRILSDAEYTDALKAKLFEEVTEFFREDSLQELADIAEVVRSLALAKGYTLQQLESARSNKAQERGSFECKIFLETVTDGKD